MKKQNDKVLLVKVSAFHHEGLGYAHVEEYEEFISIAELQVQEDGFTIIHQLEDKYFFLSPRIMYGCDVPKEFLK